MGSVFRGSENDIHSEFLESEGSVLELFLDPYQISEFSLSAYTPPAEPEMPIMTPNGTTTLGSVPTPTEDVSFVTHFLVPTFKLLKTHAHCRAACGISALQSLQSGKVGKFDHNFAF